MSKYKRTLWVALAVVLLVALFFIKNKTTFKNTLDPILGNQENGLTYEAKTLEDLVNRDTDGDTILDWEEGLWGTDPTKGETTPGILDTVAVEKLKAEQQNTTENKETEKGGKADEENLTQTDKFSREFFTTIATLNQSGEMDQATIDALGISLAERMQNAAPVKIYTIKDIKIKNSDDVQAIQKYSDALWNIYGKYSAGKEVPEVLEKLVADEENMSILKELDPIINRIKKIIAELLKMEVPPSLSILHLDLVNNSERLLENISDIRLLDTDPILSIGAIGQYWENTAALESVAGKLVIAIQQKLNN